MVRELKMVINYRKDVFIKKKVVIQWLLFARKQMNYWQVMIYDDNDIELYWPFL